jgi:hypothetical protein
MLDGAWLRNIPQHMIYSSIIGGKYGKIAIYMPGTFVRGISVCDFHVSFLEGLGLATASGYSAT